MSASHTPERLPFLLEIGSEEIPARFVPESMAELERRLAEGLAAAHLRAEGIRVVATPRRLALLVEALESPFATAEVLVPAGIEPLRFFRVGAIEVR